MVGSWTTKMQYEYCQWVARNHNCRPYIALNIFSVCLDNQITLEPEWLPREKYSQDDLISRIIDYDDWRLDSVVFADLDKRWDPYIINWFTDTYNRQIYLALTPDFLSPSSEAVDAFTCNWGEEINWWCPPIHLITRVLQHAKKTN